MDYGLRWTQDDNRKLKLGSVDTRKGEPVGRVGLFGQAEQKALEKGKMEIPD
jgi:hypothetical protein